MLKRSIWLTIVTVFLVFQMFMGKAYATELDVATRTLPLNDQGDTVVLSLEQVSQGRRLFNYACAQCHLGGVTKTNFNVDLSEASLSGATPSRTHIEGLVDYMQNPTTYDGLDSIAELHPSIASADIFPKMRNLTDDDLVAIAGHILLQPKIQGSKWGAGKTAYST